jgi:hypothetical protein
LRLHVAIKRALEGLQRKGRASSGFALSVPEAPSNIHFIDP